MKRDYKTFLVWMRNGVAFCYTWLLILLLIRNGIQGIESISTMSLVKLLAFVAGGVFLFTTLFSETFFKGVGFTLRLTCFMILFSIYESVSFYWLGVFSKQGSMFQWFWFGGIILSLYGISIFIYEIFSRKKEVVYNAALYEYQKKRGSKEW